MDHCFGLLTAEAHRLEGTINQYTGDGIMALFGAPIAHEDSPRRAVHAAAASAPSRTLAVSSGAARFAPADIRMHTGLVVVGKIGDDLRMDYTAVGDTTNLAARLQQLAEPGTVVISEATHKLVAGFSRCVTWESMPSRTSGAGARLCSVTDARAAHPLGGGGRARSDATGWTGSRADDAAGPVSAGEGGPWAGGLYHGEACIGKSRLVLECRRALTTAGKRLPGWRGSACPSGRRSRSCLLSTNCG